MSEREIFERFGYVLRKINKDIDNYEQRKIIRITPEENGGIGVSTAFSSDQGYETALLDANGAHPVERYATEEQARGGHEKWVEFARSGEGKTVTKLGWSSVGYPPDREITLRSVSEGE